MNSRIIPLLLACLIVAAPYGHGQQTTGTFFDSNGVKIHYLDKGQGLPVMLIHGFTHSAAQDWEMPGTIAALENAGYRVIALDCRGHGESDKPHEVSKYGPEMGQDVIRLLDHLHIQRAHIIGYSMGGGIANQILVNHPERVLTVTLIGAGWDGEGEEWRRFTAETEAMADGFEKRDATALYRIVVGQAPSDEQIARSNAALFARHDPEVLAAILRGLASFHQISADQLRATKEPVLAIVGEKDPYNLEAVHRMVGVMPTLQVVQMPGVTHAASVPPATPHIIAFLDKHRGN